MAGDVHARGRRENKKHPNAEVGATALNVGSGNQEFAGETKSSLNFTTTQQTRSSGAASRGAFRDLQLVAEAGEGAQKVTSSLDHAHLGMPGFGVQGSAAAESAEHEVAVTVGLLQSVGQRHSAVKWQAKSNKTAAIVLDKRRVKEKYKKKPCPPIKPLDLWWHRALTLSYTCDFVALLWFCFLAFVFLPTIDPRDLSIAMDPLAWNMSFGATAIFVGFKDVQTALNILTWFNIWLGFTVFLTLGLFYGAIRYWMYIYFGDFPCFRGGLHDNMLGFCADGMILIGLTSACLYNCGTCFFLYYWRQYNIQRMKEQGKLTHIKTVGELLDAVDDLQKTRAEAGMATKQAAQGNMIVGEAIEVRRRGLAAKTLPRQLVSDVVIELPLRASTIRQQNLSSSDVPSPGAGGSIGNFDGSYFASREPRHGDPSSSTATPVQLLPDLAVAQLEGQRGQ